jgi:hypothetical protein
MNGLIAALSAKEISAVIFAGGVVFAVCALEFFRLWLERNPAERHSGVANIIAASLGGVFLLQIACGLTLYFEIGRASFLSLGLFLTGVAGCGPLLALMIGSSTGDDDEMRRVVARDL